MDSITKEIMTESSKVVEAAKTMADVKKMHPTVYPFFVDTFGIKDMADQYGYSVSLLPKQEISVSESELRNAELVIRDLDQDDWDDALEMNFRGRNIFNLTSHGQAARKTLNTMFYDLTHGPGN